MTPCMTTRHPPTHFRQSRVLSQQPDLPLHRVYLDSDKVLKGAAAVAVPDSTVNTSNALLYWVFRMRPYGHGLAAGRIMLKVSGALTSELGIYVRLHGKEESRLLTGVQVASLLTLQWGSFEWCSVSQGPWKCNGEAPEGSPEGCS